MAERLRAFYVKTQGESGQVTRHMKCSELQVYVTSEVVATAVANKGGCATDHVRVGEIRRAHYGSNAVWMYCLVAAAKIGTLILDWFTTKGKLAS